MVLIRDANDSAARIERAIDGETARIRRAFLAAVDNIRDATTLDELAGLLEAGRIDEALTNLLNSGEVIAAAYAAGFSGSAASTAAFVSSALTTTVSYDQVNLRAVERVRQNRLRLIQEFTQTARNSVRESLIAGVTRGANPREIARDFRAAVGMTQRQVQTVENFRRLLTTARMDNLPSRNALGRALRDRRFDPTILRAIRDNEPLSAGQVDRMVGRYRERLIARRAETIGRTEALRAVHEGADEMYRQAIDAGQIQADQLSRTWLTARDERVRGSHASLNGVARAVGEVWQGFAGQLRFPGDPDAPASETVNCRCVIVNELRVGRRMAA
jgi:methylphosphotriester-DNA--protein-cysteine methyltransferase